MKWVKLIRFTSSRLYISCSYVNV